MHTRACGTTRGGGHEEFLVSEPETRSNEIMILLIKVVANLLELGSGDVLYRGRMAYGG